MGAPPTTDRWPLDVGAIGAISAVGAVGAVGQMHWEALPESNLSMMQ